LNLLFLGCQSKVSYEQETLPLLLSTG